MKAEEGQRRGRGRPRVDQNIRDGVSQRSGRVRLRQSCVEVEEGQRQTGYRPG